MGDIFLPIVKKDRLEEFKNEWGNWLVLSNDVEDEKHPAIRFKKNA